MAVAFVGNYASGTVKASNALVGATVSGSTPSTGNVLVLSVVFDNQSTTTPTVTSIDRPTGETNTWTKLGSFDSYSSSGSGGVRGEMWAILVSSSNWYTSGNTFFVSLSGTVTAKAVLVQEFSGTTLTGATSNSVVAGTGSVSVSATAASGDLVVAMGGWETHSGNTPSADSDTSNGSWSSQFFTGTSGGGAATNCIVATQYKITTGAGSQSFDSSFGAEGGGVIAILAPAATGLGATLGINTETDASVAISAKAKDRAVPVLTDSGGAAQAVSASKVKALGAATETATAQQLGRGKSIAPATEADAALLLDKKLSINPATETDSSQSITASRSIRLGTAPANLIANSGFESGVTGWDSNGAFGAYTPATSWTQSNEQAFAGSYSMKVAWPEAPSHQSWVNYEPVATTDGGFFRAMFRAYVPTGSPDLAIDFLFFSTGPDVSTKDAWVTVEHSVWTNGDKFIGIRAVGPSTGDIAYVDEAQVFPAEGARSFSRTKTLAVGTALETDTAVNFAQDIIVAAGTTTETDSPVAVTRTKTKALGTATETDSAVAASTAKTKALPVVTESDSSQPISSLDIARTVEETDQAQPFTAGKSRAPGTDTETDTLVAFGRTKTKALGTAIEAESAQPLGKVKTKAVALTTEADTAVTILFLPPPTSGNLPLVVEADTALQVVATKVKAIGTAVETAAAQTVQRIHSRIIGAATQVEQLVSFTSWKTLAVLGLEVPEEARPLSVPHFRFEPPTYQKWAELPPMTPRRPRVNIDKAVSVVRVNGSYTVVRTPTVELLEQAGQEGRDYFLGGFVYEVPHQVAQELQAAGYSVTEL